MAVVGQRYNTPNPFAVDQNGVPYSGSQLYFYESGTTTALDTYADVDLTTPNPNPVIADSNGNFGNIWLSPSLAYKVAFYSPTPAGSPAGTPAAPSGTQIWVMDPVGPASGGTPASVAGIIGEVRDFAGLSSGVPSGWYLCYGQAVSRTTYSALFAVLGTLWGAGDGSTTFNLPDLRGRATFGADNMGGVPTNRLTSGVSGIPATTIGGTGGDQNYQSHTHGTSDPGHVHAITDPTHAHYAGAALNVSGGGLGSRDQSFSASGVQTSGASTGITINTAVTGLSVVTAGTGAGGNVPPGAVVNKIIYAGV